MQRKDSGMELQRIVVGPLQVNCYIVYDKKTLDAIVIDPGDEAGRIIKAIESKNLKVRYIVCTHGHFDHVGAVGRVKEKTGATVLINKNDIDIYSMAKDQAAFWEFNVENPPQPDGFLIEGDEISVGGIKFKVMLTPGHSPGGLCLYGGGGIFTGDTIFAGSVGRTDFPGGDINELKKSFSEIISLPPETRILPGHGELTTVGREREDNFFVHEL